MLGTVSEVPLQQPQQCGGPRVAILIQRMPETVERLAAAKPRRHSLMQRSAVAKRVQHRVDARAGAAVPRSLERRQAGKSRPHKDATPWRPHSAR